MKKVLILAISVVLATLMASACSNGIDMNNHAPALVNGYDIKPVDNFKNVQIDGDIPQDGNMSDRSQGGSLQAGVPGGGNIKAPSNDNGLSTSVPSNNPTNNSTDKTIPNGGGGSQVVNNPNGGSTEIPKQKQTESKPAIKDGEYYPPIAPNNGVLHISDDYGPRDGGFHDGIDLPYPKGTPIYAIADGIVTRSGWDSAGFGWRISIDHGNGMEVWYGHCSELLVSQGDTVTKGQMIAKVGNTGDVKGVNGLHLHLRIHIDGARKDPKQFFPFITFK